MRFLRVVKVSIVVATILLQSSLAAQSSVQGELNSTQNTTSYQVDTINVLSKKSYLGDELRIGEHQIQNMPTGTQTVTDKLRPQSYIQFSQDYKRSTKGGDILPPKVSIRGSQYYENNFMIDGIANTNNIKPGEMGGIGQNPSGEGQSIFIDTDLVDSIDIHTENIDAKYGGFTGGVVDAKLKEARMDRWHFMTNFRYTTDAWAKQHLNDTFEKDQYGGNSNEPLHPKFSIREYGAIIDGPINDSFGLLLGYSNQKSTIPMWSLYDVRNADGTKYKERRKQHRDNKNLIVKLSTFGYDDFSASLSALYAPYNHDIFYPTGKDTSFTVTGGGYALTYDMKNSFNFGTWENKLSYKKNEVSRDNAKDIMYAWKPVSNGYATWDWKNFYATEGFYGNNKFYKDSIIYKSDFELEKLKTGNLEHSIKFGIDTEFSRLNSKTGGYTSFESATLDINATGEKENGIISGEQWTKEKRVTPTGQRDEEYFLGSLYISDTMNIDRFTLRPGVRISYDSLTKNVDVAPRVFAKVDAFNDNILNIYGGYNRYYGTQVLEKLYAIEPQISYKRTSWDALWTQSKNPRKLTSNLGDLDTPYSDEFTIGSSVNYWDTLFDVNYVKRDYKKQIKSKRDYSSTNDDYWYVNTGRTNYWGLTFSISKKYDISSTKHNSYLSVTRSLTKSNMQGLAAAYAEQDSEPSISPIYVVYNDTMMAAEDVPASNFNSPWVISYSHLMQLTQNFRVNALLRYQEGGYGLKYQGIERTNLAPDGKEARKYVLHKYHDTFNMDLSLYYDINIKGSKLTFGLDILNILNKKNDAARSTGITHPVRSIMKEYSMGRQFYANFKYEF